MFGAPFAERPMHLASQIQVYLPENQHPAAGLVRTVVKDSTDLDTAAFMDSDGHYNDNSARTRINGNPVNDGAWHMVRPRHRDKYTTALCSVGFRML